MKRVLLPVSSSRAPFGFCAALAAAWLSLSGCKWYAADADREVNVVLDKYTSRALGGRADKVREPRTLPPEPVATQSAPASSPTDVAASQSAVPDNSAALSSPVEAADARPITLRDALQQAFAGSRDLQDQKDALFRAGLDYTLVRYQFGPILDNTISYVYNFRENQPYNDTLSSDLSVSQVLPLGGRVSTTGRLSGSRVNNPAAPLDQQDFNYDSALTLNLRQPLLRGAGYEASHEALTQAQRSLLYAIRSFELFREDFTIQVTGSFYALVSQKRQLANDEQNYRDAIYDHRKAEALRQVDRYKDEDVFLARRREIEAEDALLQSRTRYKAALDDFRILLGLSGAVPIRIADEAPQFESINVDADSAVAVALLNRLDLHTALDQVDDAERQVRVAGNNLLPDLDVTGAIGVDSDPEPYDEARPRRSNGNVGIQLKLPFDRKAERNTYRAAQLTVDRARRDVSRLRDRIARDVLDQLRTLQQLEKRIDLQKDQVTFESRAVEVTRIRYESGDVGTRDLLDARQALNTAQNSLIALQVQHFIARLTLKRTLGTLFINEAGMWQT